MATALIVATVLLASLGPPLLGVALATRLAVEAERALRARGLALGWRFLAAFALYALSLGCIFPVMLFSYEWLPIVRGLVHLPDHHHDDGSEPWLLLALFTVLAAFFGILLGIYILRAGRRPAQPAGVAWRGRLARRLVGAMGEQRGQHRDRHHPLLGGGAY